MEIVLQHDVPRVGTKGQRVKVADGFARNFLLPRGLALPATAATIRRVTQEQQVIQARLVKERVYLRQLQEQLEGRSVTIPVAAGSDDKLFGAVTNAHIAAAITQEGIAVDKRKVLLTEPITALGVYQVPVRLHPDVTATVKVWVVKQ